MHVGGIIILDAAPLQAEDCSLDIDRIRLAVLSRLHLVPRFRQRLAYVPYERNPVWVDDDRFRLAYHVRHTALPRPGDERQLKRLVGRIMSQPLDRERPLWELWFVEGLAGDRVALINKTHHCMIDGISGAELISVMMQPFPNPDPGRPEPWVPRPRPSDSRLSLDELQRRLSQPLELAQAAANAIRDPQAALQRLGERIEAIAETLRPALRPASRTPLNVEVGPHRRVDWTRMSLADFRTVKNHLGGTVNDVVLATVAGALRRYFIQRGVDPDALRVRALVPVSVRSEDERGQLGNRVAEMIAPLPLDRADPVERLDAVRATMSGLKESKQALGAEMLTSIADWTVPTVLVQAVRLAQRTRPYNLIVTNVPGPQIPLYFLGSAMQTTYPVVPLFRDVALVIGLFSYNGGIFWGLNADWEQVPDLRHFVVALETSFQQLLGAAGQQPARKPAMPAARRARRTSRKKASVAPGRK